MNAPLELEGTWEEVAAHAPELAGRRVRLTVLELGTQRRETPAFRPASGRSLLKHTGKWHGDDFEECLQSVIESRGSVEFRGE